MTKEKAYTYKIGTSSRSEFANLKSAREMPGPGNYEIIEEEGSRSVTRYKGPSFSINGKSRDLNKNLNPGPGSYDNRDDLSKVKS